MRHKGCKDTFSGERDRALLREYHRLLAEADYVFLPNLLERLVMLPTERFYVSEERALLVVSRMMRGDGLKGMRRSNQRKYLDIYERVCGVMKSEGLSLGEAVWRVVNSPAPCFYLTPQSAKVIISRKRRG